MNHVRILLDFLIFHLLLTVAFVPHCAAGNIWGWILNHPVEQSDSAPAMALANDTTEISPGGTTRHRLEDSPNDEAKADFSVTCQSGKPCGRGKFCDAHYGKCERIKRRGDFCRKDYHCQRRHECVFGRCRKEIPKGQEGSRCSGDVDCPESHCCARQHGEFICKARLRQSMKCFVPAGGLDYSLNEQCPCENGLFCQYEPVKATTPASVGRNQKNEWFQFTTDTAQMKCLPVGQTSPKALEIPQEGDNANSRDDELTS